jgi:hypothetical protein
MAPRVDYERIEPDWRAGIKSPQQLADEYETATGHPVTRQAIVKHFKKSKIDRDLSEKIRAKARAKVAAESCRGSYTRDSATEAEIVETNALGLATVQLTQRKDIKRSRDLVMKLWDEIGLIIESSEDFSKLGEMMQGEGINKLGEIYKKVIDLPSRIDGAKKLSDALKTLIGLEREAFSIGSDGDTGQKKTFEMTRDELMAIALGEQSNE